MPQEYGTPTRRILSTDVPTTLAQKVICLAQQERRSVSQMIRVILEDSLEVQAQLDGHD